jgi:D-threo-aldose 1-dehydrogenase
MNPAEKAAIGKTKLKVSRLGLGTGLLGSLHEDEPWREIIKTAWSAGVRSFDTSPYYGFGTSEVRLGRALVEHDRGDYVISTKVGRLLRADAPEDPFAEAVYFPEGRPPGALRSV